MLQRWKMDATSKLRVGGGDDNVGLGTKCRLRCLFRRFLTRGNTNQENAQGNCCPHHDQ